MSGLESIFPYITALTGAFSVLLILSDLVSAELYRRRQLEEARSRDLSNILAAADIGRLGDFMDTTIGNFKVSDYVRDPSTTVVVDAYLDRVVQFLGTAEEVAAEPVPEPLVPPQPHQAQPTSGWAELDVLPELQQAVAELERGEVWNGLARMRRQLEIEVRRHLADVSSGQQGFRSLGQIIQKLAVKLGMPDDIRRELHQALSVGNRAVHGSDVTYDEAAASLLLADRFLRWLKDQPERATSS